MATDHTETFRAILAAAGQTNVVAGDRWPTADEAIIVLPAPGGPRVRFLDGGTRERKQDGVQVLVRGARTGYGAALARTNTVYDLLRFAAPAGYDAFSPLGGPSFIGRDGDDRPLFTINFIAQITE